MTKQETINAAKYEADNARLELLEIGHTLRAAGVDADADIVEAIAEAIEAWQNKEQG
jgi:hypothetical protein